MKKHRSTNPYWAGLALALAGVQTQAQTWNSTSGGNWSDTSASGWNAAYPNAIDASATINQDISGDTTIAMDTNGLLGSLTIGDSSGTSAYSITKPGASTLTFDVATGNASLTSLGGANTISQVNLNDSLSVAVNGTSLGITTISGANRGVLLTAGTLTIGGGSVGSGGFNVSAGATLSNSATFTGGLTVNGTFNQNVAGNQNIGSSLSGASTGVLNLTNSATRITIQHNNEFASASARTYNGDITGAGGFGVSGSSGQGALLTLTGTNTATGAVTIAQGRITAQNGNAIGDTQAVSMSHASARFAINNSETIGSLSSSNTGANTILTSGVTLTTGGNNASTTYTGIISGVNGSLVKTGTGNMTLTNALNSYTGTTTVANGTLTLGAAGSISASSAIIVGVGGTFDTTAQSYVFGSGTTTIIGVNETSAGLINAATVTFSSASLAFDFGSASTLLASYNVLLNTGDTGDFAGVTATGTSISGTFTNDGLGNWTLTSDIYDLTFSEALGTLVVSSVPEPSTYAAIFGSLALAGAAIQRRRRSLAAQ